MTAAVVIIQLLPHIVILSGAISFRFGTFPIIVRLVVAFVVVVVVGVVGVVGRALILGSAVPIFSRICI